MSDFYVVEYKFENGKSFEWKPHVEGLLIWHTPFKQLAIMQAQFIYDVLSGQQVSQTSPKAVRVSSYGEDGSEVLWEKPISRILN